MVLRSQYVEPMLFGYMFCIFLSMPVDQQLLYRKLCLKRFNTSYCDLLQNSLNTTFLDDQNLIQKQTASWGVYLDIARSSMAIFVTIFYGAWSDQVGRKTIMILPIIGDLINVTVYLLSSIFMSLDVAYLLIGLLFSACFGNVACFLSSVFSYLSDTTTKSERTKRVVILESMIYLGAVVSNLSGQQLLSHAGFTPVYILIAAVYICQIVYWWFLKESYEPVESNESKFKLLFNKERLIESWYVIRRCLTPIKLYLFLACFVILIVLFTIINSVSVLYLLHQPLNFKSHEIGYFFAELNGVKFIGALCLNYVIQRFLQWEDHSLIIICSLFYFGYSMVMAATRTHLHVYLAVLCGLGLGVGTSSCRAGLSKLVSPSEQGKLFAVTASLEVLATLVASPCSKLIYKATVDVSASFIFYVMAGCTALPFFCAVTMKWMRSTRTYVDLLEDNPVVHTPSIIEE